MFTNNFINFNTKENNFKLKDTLIILSLFLFFVIFTPKLLTFTIVTFDITLNSSTYFFITKYLKILLKLIALLSILFYIHKKKLKVFNRKEFIFKNMIFQLFIYILFLCLIKFLPSMIIYLSSYLTETTTVPVSEFKNQALIDNSIKYTGLFILFLTSVILSPILEEIVFRVSFLFLETNNTTIKGLILKNIVSSSIFGYLHNVTTIYEFLNYFLVGFLLGLVVLQTNKLELSIAFHMANNLSSFLLYIA